MKQLNDKLFDIAYAYLNYCGSCTQYHPYDFNGDCRDDNNRYYDPEELVNLWESASDLLDACRVAHDLILGITESGWDISILKPYQKELRIVINKARGEHD